METTLKLLNSFVSPFAARARLAIYAYDLPVEIAPSGMWLPNFEKAPHFLAINPIGRVPVLMLEDGTALPESGVIVEHLADAFPGSRLRPEDPGTLAKARLLAHLMETYVQPRSGPLFAEVFAAERNRDTIEGCVAAIDQGLAYLDHYWDDAALGPDGAPTIADCALVPHLFFSCDRMVAALDGRPIIRDHPRVAAYWARVQELPLVSRVLGEMREAIGSSPMRALVEG